MALNFFKHKWQKVTVITLVSLLVIVLAALLLIDNIAGPKISKKLKTELEKSTDSLYRVEFGDFELHTLRGQITIKDLKLIPNTARYEQLKKAGKAPNNLYKLSIDNFNVTGIHFMAFLLHKKLEIGRIIINTPVLQTGQYLDKDKKPEKKDSTIYQKIKKDLKLIQVGNVQINNANYKISNYTKATVTKSELKELNFTASDLLIDSATQTDTSRTLFCKDILVETFNYKGKSANGMYSYRLRSLRFSTRTSQLRLGGVVLQPAPAAEFFSKERSDRFTVKMDSVVLHNFDYAKYNQTQDMDISRLAILGGMFEVYSNYNGQPQATDRLVTFPNWALRHAIKAQVRVDTLEMKRFSVTYKQFNKSAKRTGTVVFSNITARFRNLTNKKELLKNNNICTASLTSYFMGKGKLDITFRFNLTDPAYSYSYKGHLGTMDMAVANPAVMPLSLVKLASGRVKSLDFAVQSTQKTSTGTVNFLYNNLDVEVLRPDYTKKTLLSTLANSFIIKHDNPDDGNTVPRTAKVVFIRPASFPFFRTVWLTVLNGMKACVGVGPSQEKRLNKDVTEDELKEEKKLFEKAKKNKEKEDKKHKEELEKKKKE